MFCCIPLKYSEQEQLSKLKTKYDNRLKEANIDDPRSSDVKEWPKIDLGKFKIDTDNAFEDFSSNTIGNLKDFSSTRGRSCMGNKQQLISRCFVAFH
ncbi:Hypothetical predicted protein [Mytilus galloprovincialis]|uniref:SAP domain-containing protein n=1 Tax=Mytilus galloprovincialis TaxID=29158 RepID=A0A8B6CCH0_MYTGA|nr:Hypothetical predicted protein [Mytilus galloprovincialis]